jgi:protein TonB
VVGGVPGGVPGGSAGGIIGGIIGSVCHGCSAASAAAGEAVEKPVTPQRIRVGGHVQGGQAGAPAPAGVSAVGQASTRFRPCEVLNAIIGKDGTIQNLTLASGPPLLVQAAMQAVKQWVYQADTPEWGAGGSGNSD